MVLLLRKLNLYLTKDTEAVHYFLGGPTFSRGRGPNANFYRNPYTYLLFFRGCPDPLSASGSAQGQCHHNGTIFIKVNCQALICQD